MLKRWFITFFFCLAIVAALATYKFLEIQQSIDTQTAQPEYFETVEVFTPLSVKYVPIIKTLGLAIAPQQITLRNELPGYITAVHYASGETVEQGEVIIQLDLSEQLANLASAQAQAELAQIIYDRNLELRKTNVVPQEVLDRSLSELNVVKAAIAGIRSVMNRREIRAPFTGIIGIHQLEPGEYLSVNSEITTLVGVSKEMWIDFSLSQFYGELEVGTTIHARPVLSASAGNNPFFEATIIAGNSFVATAARSRLYRANVTNTNIALLHNASLELEVPVGVERSLISVPSPAVRGNAEGQFVFVLDPEANQNTYRARPLPVTIEVEKDGFSYITGALTTDSLVASAGAFKLSKGMLVHANTRPSISTMTSNQ